MSDKMELTYKTDANGLVIGMEELPGGTEPDEAPPRLFSNLGVPLYKVQDGTFLKRTNGEISADEAALMVEEEPLPDEGGESAQYTENSAQSITDRLEALEQEMELLLSGETE